MILQTSSYFLSVGFGNKSNSFSQNCRNAPKMVEERDCKIAKRDVDGSANHALKVERHKMDALDSCTRVAQQRPKNTPCVDGVKLCVRKSCCQKKETI